jgi:hypothetical protein
MFEAGHSAQAVATTLGIGLRTAFKWRGQMGFPPPNAGKAFAEARKKPKLDAKTPPEGVRDPSLAVSTDEGEDASEITAGIAAELIDEVERLLASDMEDAILQDHLLAALTALDSEATEGPDATVGAPPGVTELSELQQSKTSESRSDRKTLLRRSLEATARPRVQGDLPSAQTSPRAEWVK